MSAAALRFADLSVSKRSTAEIFDKPLFDFDLLRLARIQNENLFLFCPSDGAKRRNVLITTYPHSRARNAARARMNAIMRE